MSELLQKFGLILKDSKCGTTENAEIEWLG